MREDEAVPQEPSSVELSLSWLATMLDAGVLVFDAQGTPVGASPLVYHWLGCLTLQELDNCLHDIKPQLLPGATASAPLSRSLSVDLGILQVDAHALGAGGRCGTVLLLRDRHALDAFNANLLSASRMRTLSYLQAFLGHDLRIPLNAMQIAVELLAGTLQNHGAVYDAAALSRGERYVAVLREEIARLGRALDLAVELLGMPDNDSELFDLRELVEEVGDRLQTAARRRGRAVRTIMSDGALTLVAPREGLRQALFNMAINRLEAMAPTTELRIEAQSQPPTYATVLIVGGSDLEATQASENLPTCFCLSKTGSAFVLGVARAMVESLGGEISVGESPDHLVCFRLTLPLLPRATDLAGVAN